MEPYRMALEAEPGCLHATAYGEGTADNARRFLEEVHAACMARGVDTLLLEVRSTRASFEMVAMNRGVNVRLFRDVESARAWVKRGDARPG